MAYQKYINPIYLDKLQEEVEDGIDLLRYCGEEFPIPDDALKVIPQINEPIGLVEKMSADDEFSAAVELYRAYKILSPVQATDVYFWKSLAHLNLFQYVKKRWPIDGTNLNGEFIKQHWFVSTSFEFARHALASLWWSVYLTEDEELTNPYELTQVLFQNKTFRTRTYGTSLIFPIREANMGILRYILDHPELMENFEKAGMEIYKHFNRLGAIKQLSCMDRDFFYEEMGRFHNSILAAIKRNTSKE